MWGGGGLAEAIEGTFSEFYFALDVANLAVVVFELLVPVAHVEFSGSFPHVAFSTGPARPSISKLLTHGLQIAAGGGELALKASAVQMIVGSVGECFAFVVEMG